LTALVGSGLSLVGGVYYPVQLLPHGLRAVADLLPFTWALDALRASLLQGQEPLARLGLLAGVAAVALPASLGLFSAALRRARRLGTLAQY
ncbi:MAG TPA: ABC transporter permease, partial [Acidimicrobiales bacterium]|nr:ABC transporter permease [Acidimicrobiales bacterium]